jgi:hypothetical protein
MPNDLSSYRNFYNQPPENGREILNGTWIRVTVLAIIIPIFCLALVVVILWLCGRMIIKAVRLKKKRAAV